MKICGKIPHFSFVANYYIANRVSRKELRFLKTKGSHTFITLMMIVDTV
jgi:hypothetical protein